MAKEAFSERLIRSCLEKGATGRILLAVSGGADSLAMLRGALECPESALKVTVAHFDHCVRLDSSSDAAWVAAQCAVLGVICLTGSADVPSIAAETGRGIEETARRLRYDFLERIAAQHNIATVATAHSANDHAETVLHHLLRGTGLRGLRGISPKRKLSPDVTLIRPMLQFHRVEIEAYLAEIGQPFLTDSSNSDTAFTRNRLRHELLPQLRESINPNVEVALLRLSMQATEASAVLRRLARRHFKRAILEATPDLVRLNARCLKTQPRIIVREVIVLAWKRVQWPRQSMSFAHWDALAGIVVEGGRRTLPGGTDARRRQGELILRRRQS